MKTKKALHIILHPILIALCPVLSMYFANRWIIAANDFWTAIGIMLAVAIFLWGVFYMMAKNVEKSALLVSFFIILMFIFQTLLFGTNSLFVTLGLTNQMLPWLTSDANLIFWSIVELCLFALILRQIITNKWNHVFLSNLMNTFATTLFFVTLLSWLPTETNRAIRQKSLIDPFETGWNSLVQNETCILKKPAGPMPDIYVIILDGYLRDDALRQVCEVDNSPFIAELEKRGFFVARNARSNYKHTALTLSSLFNYDYLETLNKTTGLETLSEPHLGTIIQKNRAFNQLKCLGYKITSLDSGFFYADFPNSDRIISTSNYPGEFAYRVASATPATLFTLPSDYERQRKRILTTLEKVQTIPQIEEPQLVFAHIMAAHTPFIFGRDGQPINPPRETLFDAKHYFQALISKEDSIRSYSDQLVFITNIIPQMVDGIIANSKTPPIIILMGDHGMKFYFVSTWEKMSILNAYYFPDGNTSQLYPGITPVNSLRVVFNTYFQAGLPLLPDISNFAPQDNLSNYEDVTDQIPDNPRVEETK
jgi:hypothetical protein